MTLREKIEQEILERGPIPFSRYMELCLYDPELGYYSRTAEQFGKAGDFYTSSDVHAVFGRLLARQFEEMWHALGSPAEIEILELGPGRGLFAQDVLDWSEKKFPEFFAALHYSLLERSPSLRQRIAATLSRHVEAGKASLLMAPALQSSNACKPERDVARKRRTAKGTTAKGTTAQAMPGEGTTSVVPQAAHLARALAPEVPLIVFANEFFDALPVEALSSRGALRISTEKGRFVETWAPASSQELQFLDCYSVHPEADERVEISFLAQQYSSLLAGGVRSGFIVCIDYGYTRQEQLAGRHRGTVTAYCNHSVSASPYEAPGEQDITAHVNFTALADALKKSGMEVQAPLTQSQFLLGIGEANQFADAFEGCRLPQERVKVSLQLKHLITPAGIGETFHVLLASKGVPDAGRLSGLNFGRGNESHAQAGARCARG